MLGIEWVECGRKYIFEGTIDTRDTRAMPETKEKKEDFPDDEVEEIMNMHAPKDQISVAEARKIIRENPLLVAGLVFTFGLLVGVSLSSRKK